MSANGLHRIRWRRVAVARIHRTAASQFARDLINIQQSIVEEGVENVGKRTPSDPMETGCRGKNPSDCREWGWKMSANGLHLIRWRRVAAVRIHRTVASQ